MKQIKQSYLKTIGWFSAILLIGCSSMVLFSTSAIAGDVQIVLSESACVVSMSTPGGDGCDTGQCGGEEGCVCAAKGDFISWTLPGDDKFKMKFTGDSPLKDNCGKNFKKNDVKCKIKEEVTSGQEYAYMVMLEKCANGTDPRIVIK